MSKRNYHGQKQKIDGGFGPRWSWRLNCDDLKKRKDEVVSLAIMAEDVSDAVPVEESRVVILRSGPKVNWGAVCRPYLDDAGDLRIGGDVCYTIDNNCAPRGNAQGYRKISFNPDKVFERLLKGVPVKVRSPYLRAKSSGPFSIRVLDGWVQLVVGKFHPFVDGSHVRTETDIPDVIYSFPVEELLGENPAIVLNVTNAGDVVSKIREAVCQEKPSVLGKKLEYDRVGSETVLATLTREVAMAVGQPYFDSRHETSKAQRPEEIDEAEVLNAMLRFHNSGSRGAPEDWEFNILLKAQETGELLPHQRFREEDSPHALSDGEGNPLLFIDCSLFKPFWVKMRQGHVAILPPIDAVSTLFMNKIEVSFERPLVVEEETLVPIKPVTV